MLIDLQSIQKDPYLVPVMIASMSDPVIAHVGKVMKAQMRQEKVRLHEQHKSLGKATVERNHRLKAHFAELHRRSSF